LSRSSVARGTLKLELTDRWSWNPEHAAQMLTRIRELGVGLSLDDFGTAFVAGLSAALSVRHHNRHLRAHTSRARGVILNSIIALGTTSAWTWSPRRGDGFDAVDSISWAAKRARLCLRER